MQYSKDTEKNNSHETTNDQFELAQENLIPFYVLEDNLRGNFKKITQFIAQQSNTNTHHKSELCNLQQQIKEIDSKYSSQFPKMEESILGSIKRDLDGTVSLLVNQKLSLVVERLEQMEGDKQKMNEIMDGKVQAIRKKLLYEVSQENQKFFSKEVAKIKKDIDSSIQKGIAKANPFRSSISPSGSGSKFKSQRQQTQHTHTDNQSVEKSHQESVSQVTKNHNQFQQNSSYVDPQFLDQIAELKKKVERVQDFSTSLDKRFYENMSSLKENWKDLATELLDNKKTVNKKVDNLSIEMVKLKNMAEFVNMPQIAEESYKKRIVDKFNEIYQQLTTFTPKREFESNYERQKKTLTRQGEELQDIRKQLAQNSEYFTFFMNNSNTEDLSNEVGKLRKQMLNDKRFYDEVNSGFKSDLQQINKVVGQIGVNIGEIEEDNRNADRSLKELKQQDERLDDKIKYLEDLNNIGPSKMKKIHDSLDMDFVGGDDLIHSNNFAQGSPTNDRSMLKQIQSSKELKHEIDRLKDQVFILASERYGSGSGEDSSRPLTVQVFNSELKKIEQKIEKIKANNDQAILSTKPWVCLSCDKEKYSSKEKELLEKQKSTSKKKISLLENGKSGGFLSNRGASEKNLTQKQVMSATPEDKFQVYEKFREKYLRDNIKLPEIYKEKISGENSDRSLG